MAPKGFGSWRSAMPGGAAHLRLVCPRGWSDGLAGVWGKRDAGGFGFRAAGGFSTACLLALMLSGLLQPDLVWTVARPVWPWAGWAGVRLVRLVLDWLCQCQSGCAGVSPVVPVAGRRWRSRTVPWCSKAVLGKGLRVFQAVQLCCYFILLSVF